MATLVLSAVGSAIGGPIGGAIGSALGNAIDRSVLLRPKPREGPRLTELGLQTSSYGTQIPKLFGTIRVGGTVIWSTDLIETRSKSKGGKGQPATTSYSYAASFAVLLSARAVRSVERIWADGKLLRGAAGDLKVAGAMRLHLGDEEQSVDPLIAAAEGAALTPAHRGQAYLVFEQLQLADYGNRIPQLTFEIVADEGPVAVGTIATALADEVDAEAATMLDGFAATGGSVGAVLGTLGDIAGAAFACRGDRLAMRDGMGDAATIEDAGVGGAARGVRSIAASDTAPRAVAVAYHDRDRDYQTGVQRAARPGPGWREDRVDVPAALSADAAKTLATAILSRAEATRIRRTVTTGFAAMALGPGDTVRIAGESGSWRIVEATTDAKATTLAMTPFVRTTLPAEASAGRVAAAPDLVIGQTLVEAFELPALDDALLDAPRLSIAATGRGEGWRQAALLYSLDDGASWIGAGATALPATMGSVVVVAPARGAALYDLAGSFEVDLARADMMLEDADDAALDRGANLALIGEELVQFARAEPVGGARWRLSRLLRGRRGTEAASGAQMPGDRFVLLGEDSVRTIELPLSAVGRRVRVMAAGVDDGDSPGGAVAALQGASVLPPCPVAPRVTEAADGAVAIGWTRRSRIGWRWIDSADAPIGEEQERYRATVLDGAGVERTLTLAAPALTVPAAWRAGGPVRVRVVQVGTFGESPPLQIIVSEKE